jgi:hypothetical protein
VEEAGKTIREFTRVLKEHVEDKAKVKLKTDAVVVQWMIRWAAMLVSRFMVGKDGRTSYERRKGRRCRIATAAFGEKVWYKEVRENKERKDKFCTEEKEGIWLGHTRNTNEAVIGTKAGVVRAYSVRRQAPDDRWDGDLIKAVAGSPQQPDPGRPGETIPVRVTFDPSVVEDAVLVQPMRNEKRARRMKITEKILQDYGFTEGCEGCRFKQAGLGDGREHSEACRVRLQEAMQESEEGRRKLRKEAERLNMKIAEEMEVEESGRGGDAAMDEGKRLRAVSTAGGTRTWPRRWRRPTA